MNSCLPPPRYHHVTVVPVARTATNEASGWLKQYKDSKFNDSLAGIEKASNHAGKGLRGALPRTRIELSSRGLPLSQVRRRNPLAAESGAAALRRIERGTTRLPRRPIRVQWKAPGRVHGWPWRHGWADELATYVLPLGSRVAARAGMVHARRQFCAEWALRERFWPPAVLVLGKVARRW